MRVLLLFLTLAVLGYVAAHGGHHHNHHNHEHDHAHDDRDLAEFEKCGTMEPDPLLKRYFELEMEANGLGDREAKHTDGLIVITTYWHSIRTSKGKYGIKDSMIHDSMDVLNKAYESAGYYFDLKEVTKTDNDEYYYAQSGDQAIVDMKTELRQGGSATLNIYSNDINAGSRGTLGFATFPWDYRTDPILDGVVVGIQTAPGGDAEPYNEGDTLVHEVGHWMGLYHVFQDGCLDGDFVADTPPQLTPTFGCPDSKDTCDAPGSDSITNYMDYSDDVCLDNFTQDQIMRMMVAWDTYRDTPLPYLAFVDNTQGYCELGDVGDIEAVGVLMSTKEENLLRQSTLYQTLNFPEFGNFVRLARKFINDDLDPESYEAKAILNTLTMKDEPGRDESLSPGCEQALLDAITFSTEFWFIYMNVGAAIFDFPVRRKLEERNLVKTVNLGDELLNDLGMNLPLFLDILEDDTVPTVYKFIQLIIFKYRVLDVRTAMDIELPFYIGQNSPSPWYEAASIAQSFPAKYAAFVVTMGYDMVDIYETVGIDDIFTNLYASTVLACTPPTQMPSSMPSLGPASLEQFIPCVAVVDTGGPTSEALEESWASFRMNWERPFCILEVRAGGDGILAPVDMVLDPKVTYKFVNRDRGEIFYNSDWYDLCGLNKLNPGDTVAAFVFVDEGDVQASYDYFLQRLNNNGLLLEMPAARNDDNWIEPFNRPFLETAEPSSVPTMSPSRVPTMSPSDIPTMAPSIVPSAPPTIDPAELLATMWLNNHPLLASFSEDRKQQLLAMATIYYATAGASWSNSERWLSYDDNECTWYNDAGGNACTEEVLVQLDLNDNSLAGTLPTATSKLTNLTDLVIEGNEGLSGSLPPEIGTMTLLQQLDVEECSITGSIPVSFGGLSSLRELDLAGNSLVGSIPESFAMLSNLEEMDLSSNSILVGSVPDSLYALPKLSELNLDDNFLTGSLPSTIGLSASLRTLDLEDNSFNSTIPTELGLVTTLDSMDLSNNLFSGPLPSELASLTLLTRMNLEFNLLTGTIPEEFWLLSNLEILYMGGNLLGGSLPTSIGFLNGIRQLAIEENSHTGTLPDEIGLVVTLERLWLRENDFTGTLPTTLGLLTNLERLYLNDNDFRGTIPGSMASLTGLTVLDVLNTQLTGSIPSELCGAITFNETVCALCGCGMCPCPPTEFPTQVPTQSPTNAPTSAPSQPPSEDSGFSLGLQFIGADSTFQTVIREAADRFESIITGDLPSVTLAPSQRPTPCGLASSVIDDVEICVIVEELPRNILGVGGVRLARVDDEEGTLLPATGEISIDRSAHENNPSMLRDTAEHELLHALGVGILFDAEQYALAGQNVLKPNDLDMPLNTCFYRGDTEAALQFQIISGCPSGTAIPMTESCGHWSEDCFLGSELMGPFGGPSLSEITVGSLEDLGFEVDYSQADSLYRSDLSPLCRCGDRTGGGRDETDNNTVGGDASETLNYNDLNRFRAVQFAYQRMGQNQAALNEAENQGLLTPEETGLKDIGPIAVSVLYLDENGKVRDVIVKNPRARL